MKIKLTSSIMKKSIRDENMLDFMKVEGLLMADQYTWDLEEVFFIFHLRAGHNMLNRIKLDF
jgi:hypothetical protein